MGSPKVSVPTLMTLICSMKGYSALVLRLTDEVVEALFVTYDLWKS